MNQQARGADWCWCWCCPAGRPDGDAPGPQVVADAALEKANSALAIAEQAGLDLAVLGLRAAFWLSGLAVTVLAAVFVLGGRGGTRCPGRARSSPATRRPISTAPPCPSTAAGAPPDI